MIGNLLLDSISLQTLSISKGLSYDSIYCKVLISYKGGKLRPTVMDFYGCRYWTGRGSRAKYISVKNLAKSNPTFYTKIVLAEKSNKIIKINKILMCIE